MLGQNVPVKMVVKHCLRHQAVYSQPFNVKAFCEVTVSSIKHIACLVPITTTVNNSNKRLFFH